MNSLASSGESQVAQATRLLAELLSHLQNSQNSDGGWSFHGGGDSRVEPTCWALIALANSYESAQAHIARGLAFVKSLQLPDGAWPAASGMSSGGWVTSLAALTLTQFPANEKSVSAALQWLCDDYPRDSSRWQKFLKSLSSAKQHASHNDEFRGWGWTPRTSSWVEPTSFALMAFAAVSAEPEEASLGFSPAAPGSPSAGSAPVRSERPDFSSRAPASVSKSGIPIQLAKQISDRRSLATGLLYDRMCAGGGWNCGNPRVYGVDGDSLILPTCWALLALRDTTEHPNRALSLAWLQKSFAAIASAGSHALAQITLQHYGIPVPAAPRNLRDWSVADLTEQGTHVAAWAALALNSSRIWPSRLHYSSATHPESPA